MLAAALLSAGIANVTPVFSVDELPPSFKNFRTQQIHRARTELDWPFKAEKGLLFCLPFAKNRLVYFLPQNGETLAEYPIALDYGIGIVAMVNMGQRDAFQPFDSFEQLLKRLGPYIGMGKRLCDQPAGTHLPDTTF